MHDAIVIGRGIMGATIAKALEGAGRKTLVIDAGKADSGTAPSGGHVKPSWLGGMAKADYLPAMDFLDKLWGLKEEHFIIRPGKLTTTVYRVDVDLVMKQPYHLGTVDGIENLGTKTPTVVTLAGEEFQCKLLVVCAGNWCQEILPDCFTEVDRLTVRKGVSFRFHGQVQPFIDVWAPYKQIVAHQQTKDEIWIGDGTAILPDNWKGREGACRTRCSKALGATKPPVKVFTGLRPYCSAHPCLLRQVGPSAWVATGAGKLGTIAAGYAAGRILDAIV